MGTWLQGRLESLLDNVIFAVFLATGLSVWAIISHLPGPIIALIFLVAIGAVLWILRQIRRLNASRRRPESVLPHLEEMTKQKYIADSYIRGRIISLLDMLPPGATPIISNRTIEDCELRGPSIIAALHGVTMSDCGFDGDPKSVFIEVLEGRIIGAIGLKDCVFRRCRFIQIGIIGTAENIRKIREGFIAPIPK